MIPAPPKLSDLRAGTVLHAGLGSSTILADIDFETYSPAGFVWHEGEGKFIAPRGATSKGLPAVGSACYTEHPEAEVLSCAYNLKDGLGARLWIPTMPPPFDLFDHVQRGGLLEAWNCAFERWVWDNICVKKYLWIPLPRHQLRDAMAKARAFALPGKLDNAGAVLDIQAKKDKRGKRLLDIYSIPRKPTKKDNRFRILPDPMHPDTQALYEYNIRDIEAEAEISSLIPDLPPDELEFWLVDQTINARGVRMDRESIRLCMSIVDQAHKKYNSRLITLTEGKVKAASEIQKLRAWLMEYGVSAPSLAAETVTELLKIESLPAPAREALDIREKIGSAAVKKLYAMNNTLTSEGRIHDLFIYHSARTGRAAGAGAQPQNLPNSGLNLYQCGNTSCNKYYGVNNRSCPWCGHSSTALPQCEWNPQAMDEAFETIACGNLELIECVWGDAIGLISGCLRGLFVASPGHDLICSDYSAIEAVVLAALAGEEWRNEVFRTHGKIYEMSASKITGIPFEDFTKYKKETGQHHPMRKKVGKVAELASGYQGWIGAWKQFGADEFFNDNEIKQAVLAWRAASPAIVNMWGSQTPYDGLEGAAVQAILMPGQTFTYRGISYIVVRDVLYCQLLSGRHLVYHRPMLSPSDRRPGTYSISFEGWNTNPKQGGIGWIRMYTYGGKLTENVVQATARDILAHAIVNLEKAGYSIVLHVHDEIVAEVPENFGSVSEFEQIMSKLPDWAQGWSVVAKGGWRGKRYTK
jgi:DNA polymerase